jgi:hypothetical protein
VLEKLCPLKTPRGRVDEAAHLLGLLQQSLPEELPRDVLDDTAGLLEALIDGHRADGYVAVAHDPFARLVDILPRRKVHHRIGTTDGSPLELFNLLHTTWRSGTTRDGGNMRIVHHHTASNNGT